METATASADEWKSGWRTVLGSAIAAGTGVNLLYYVFSLFIPHLQKETGWTLGQFSQLQALVGLGSLAAPLAGWAMDRYGVRRVWAWGMFAIALLYLIMGWGPLVPWLFGVMIFMTGLIGVATTSIAYTRTVNGWFVEHRGLALALATLGLSISALLMSPALEWLITHQGWRAGYFALAGVALFVGLPAILFLTANPSARIQAAQAASSGVKGDGFYKSAAFWLLCLFIIAQNAPGSGFLSQLVPMLLEEGLASSTAALGISAFALGQFAGRLGSGWLLDRVSPQRVAFFFTLAPAVGCVLLWQTQGLAGAALFAAAMIGVQQGAEIDLLAYFVARRFGLNRYGSIYGWVQAAGWAGTLGGVLLFGKVHDWTGSYSLFQATAILSYVIAAITILFVALPKSEHFRHQG